jgi:molybdopterin converting factor small subunit
MAIVWIPPLMRDLTAGQETVTVSGATVRDVIAALDCSFPGIQERLCDAHGIRAGITVAIDTEIARLGLGQAVGADSEVHFLPAIGGGSAAGR